MLWTITVILLVLWVLGLVSGSTMGAWVHILLLLDGKPHELVPGSYVVIPAKTHHELDCGASGECLLLTRRAGPMDYNFVK